jgi:hypothetical protein
MKRSGWHQGLLFAAAALMLAIGSDAALAAAGKVVFVKGDAKVERAGKTLPLANGAAIESGDVIVTGQDGRVQLLMADGDRMALRTNTRFRVDEFKAPVSRDKPETGRGFYSLIKGGFRAVTRSLDRRGLESYRVKTPVATIGIRGTAYWVIQWPGDANNPPGFYFGVSEGGISVGNDAGQMDFTAGQFGYVKDLNSPPQRLDGPPSFLNGQGGPNGGSDNGGGGGYTGGSALHGCTNTTAGDFNCPPVQPIQGDGFDFTPGQPPSRDGGPIDGPGDFIIEGPQTDR